MTMHFAPGPRPFLPATILPVRRWRRRAFGSTVREIAATAIESPRGLLETYLNRLMRARMKRAPHAMSDRLLADIGMTRGEIDAAVDGFIPHHRSAR
jgi:uncharacterized protein YjiS (DUF1127 family)